MVSFNPALLTNICFLDHTLAAFYSWRMLEESWNWIPFNKSYIPIRCDLATWVWVFWGNTEEPHHRIKEKRLPNAWPKMDLSEWVPFPDRWAKVRQMAVPFLCSAVCLLCPMQHTIPWVTHTLTMNYGMSGLISSATGRGLELDTH